MKTRALLLALPLVALASCRDNRASVQVQAICFPSKDCTFATRCDKNWIGFTTLDTNGPVDLQLFLQVENQLPDNTDRTAGRLNTNDAHLDEVSVEYDGISLARDVYELPNFLVPANGTAVISVQAIRPVAAGRASAAVSRALLAAFAPGPSPRDMVANVRLRGYLDDGSRFETGEFPMGVRVCTGCLAADPCPGELACPIAGMEPVNCGTASGG